MSSRIVMPKGASYWPGRATCPDTEKMPWPLDFSVPMVEYHWAPRARIAGTEAMVSTLLTTVGRA